jgi:hypothetical protein
MSSTSSERIASTATGYASAVYIRALGQIPLPLGATGGHLVARPFGARSDLAGPYPIFTCTDWPALAEAVATLPTGPVTLTLVADPFQPLGQAGLAAIFPICRRLHDHWVIDLARPGVPSSHHRKELRRAGPVRIQFAPADPAFGPAWAGLYANLVARKDIRDARAFSAESLSAQLAVPGAHLVTAWDGETLLGADLYYLDRGRAFAHLSAYAPAGYARSVSYPMLAAAMDYLAPLASVLDLGGAPGGPAGQGIADFKRGWTQHTIPSYLCGKVLDPAAYTALAPDTDPGGFFPAYRAAEFRR